MEPKREIKNTGKIVRQLLKDDVRTRNCDKYLWLRVTQIFLGQNKPVKCGSCFDFDKGRNPLMRSLPCAVCGGSGFILPGSLTITLSDLMRLPSPETVIRMRAKIQNTEQIYLPTIEAVRRKRLIKEEVYLQWAQTNF